jgi:hypothetical protein
MAFCASPPEPISTKPKPRELTGKFICDHPGRFYGTVCREGTQAAVKTNLFHES